MHGLINKVSDRQEGDPGPRRQKFHVLHVVHTWDDRTCICLVLV